MAALSGSRRQLDFGLFDEVPLPGALETRTAARKWAESKGIFVGCFSQPQLTPDDKEVTTARCGECSDCWQGQGTVYRFVVEVVEQITKVRVYKAAQCSGPARTARAAPKHKEDELTVAEKRLISQMADQLQERGQNATSSAVMVRLQAKHPEAKVAANRVRRLLRHRKKVLGLTTSKFKESAADLTKTIDQLDARLCKVVQVSTAPPVGWICIMPRFLEELKAGLQAEGSTAWYLCADFTHTLEIMGFQYGLCSAMVLRMAKGEHVRTFWPLMLQCGSEDGDNYSAGFEKLHAELIEWGIPSPSQVHLDWFSSSKKAAQRVWPRAVVCRSIQHLRRNLLRNHRKGRRPPHPRKKKTKDHADSRRNRRNCSQPRLGEKKPKLAPHLKERSIFAFFDLFNRLMLVPSLSMHHLLLEIVLRRISNVWGDTSWVQYFEEQYCSKKRVDAELYGVDQVYKCDWWSGSASSGASWLPTPPSSQQVAEAANCKLKRDIKSQGPLSSHSVVLQTLSFCVGCWLKPARASDDGKPVGLLGETSVSRPPGPDEWMLQKDGRYLRPPFAKDMMWVPSVCRILQLMRKWKESHDEYQHGNFKYLVMAVGQPTKVPPGLAVRMRDMLKCQKITVLQEKLMSEGIVADEDGELVFDIDAWDKIWGKYALIWHNGDPAHPVRCSCWMWSFRNHCVHAYSAEEFWNIRVHTSPIIEGPPPSAKRRAASQEPSRRRR